MRKAGKMMSIKRPSLKGGWIPGGAEEGTSRAESFSDMLLERRKWLREERERRKRSSLFRPVCSKRAVCFPNFLYRTNPEMKKHGREAYLYIKQEKTFLTRRTSLPLRPPCFDPASRGDRPSANEPALFPEQVRS